VRRILRGAEPSNYTLSSFVLGIVTSPAFQMKAEPAAETATAPAVH